MKLSTKLTILVLVAVLLPLFGLGWAIYVMQKQVTEERLQQQLQQQGVAAIGHIRDHLIDNYRDLALVAGSSTLRPHVWTPGYGLNRYLASFPTYDALIYTNERGKLIAHAGSPLLTEGDTSLEQAASDWHQAALAGVKIIDRVTPKPGAMSRYLVFAREVSDPGTVHGWVFAQVNSEKIVGIIEKAKIGETGHITLFNRSGILIGHPNKSRYGFDMSAYPILRKPLAEGKGDPGNFFVSGDGREKWGLTMMLSDQGELANLRWGIIVDQTREELYGPIVDLRNTILLGAAVFGMAFILFGIFFARRLIAPLSSVKRTLNGFFDYLSGKAGPPVHLDIGGNDEFAQMAQAIDESIKVAEKNIRHARVMEVVRDEALNRLNKIAARLPGSVFQFRMRPDGRFGLPYASDAINEIYRLKADDLRGDASPIFSVVHPDDLAGHLDSIQTSAQTLLPWQNVYRLRFADGTERWLHVNATPERESDGGTLWHGFVTDITEQKRAEIERQTSAKRYQTIIQTSFDGYWLVDLKGNLIDVNESAAEMLGYSRKAMLGLGVQAIDTIDTPEDIAARIERMLKTGGERFETKHRKQSGDIIDIEASISVLPDGSAFVVFVRDITERKAVEAKLMESEERWKFALEGAGDGVWDWNIQTGEALFSRRWKEMLGFAENEIENKSTEWISRVHPDDMPGVMARIQAHIDGSTPSAMVEFRMLRKEGRWQWTLGRGMVVSRDASGKPMRLIGTNTDISERKATEEVLKASEQRFRDLVNTTDGIVWEADARTFKFTFISEKAVTLLGFPAADWLETGFWVSRLHPEDANWAPKFCASCTGRLEPHDFNYRFIARDGRTVWLHDIVTVVAEEGAPRWLRGIMVDITAHKQAEIAIQASRDRLNAILQTTIDGYWLVDLKGRLIDANDAAAKMLGYTREAMLQLGTNDIDAIDTPADTKARIERIIKSGGERFETRHRTRSSDIIDVEVSVTPLPDQSALVVFVHDITQRKRAILALEESERAFRKVLEASNEGVLLLDSTGAFVECNQAALDLLKMTRKQFIHMTPDQISAEFQPNGRRSEEYAPEINALGWKGFHRFEWTCRNLEGAEFTIEVSLMPITLKGQQMLHCTWRDISKRKQMEEQVRQLAFYDTLTHLPNRRLLHDRLSLALATSKRKGVHGALLFLDLDNFKPLNDAYGHDVGDLLLIDAASRLQACVRAVDTVSRFGGDEFVVVISELEPTLDKSVEQARSIAEKIRVALSETYVLMRAGPEQSAGPIEHRCTVSIGVDMFFDHVGSPEELMKRADTAMYRAKEAGRNRICFGDSISVSPTKTPPGPDRPV